MYIGVRIAATKLFAGLCDLIDNGIPSRYDGTIIFRRAKYSKEESTVGGQLV